MEWETLLKIAAIVLFGLLIMIGIICVGLVSMSPAKSTVSMSVQSKSEVGK